MMTKQMRRRVSLLLALCLGALLRESVSQTPVNQTQQLVFAGLRSAGMQGQVNGVASDGAGNLYLLLDQKDGVRLLKTDNSGTTVLAQALLGAAGDVGQALTLAPGGQVLVTGTSTSTSLTGTANAAIPQRTDISTNSFVAGLDSSLNVQFLTFTGGSRISASAIAATSDAVFVTGSLYGSNLPVTTNGVQQSPASGSFGNGFVERFSLDGSRLICATYLTGASGDTTPAAIVADSTDAAYVAGSTSATGFPTLAALAPAMLSNPSGFLTKLTPAGDAFTFSTFIPGPGLTSLALDTGGATLLASGTVAPGQFPVDSVTGPLLPVSTQVLLKLSLDGSAVQSSIALTPGQQSHVVAGAGSTTWVDGLMTLPLLPGTPLEGLGQGFAIRLTGQNEVDQSARFGGLPDLNPSFSSLPARVTSLTLDPAGEVLVAGAMLPTASASLLSTQTYDLPLLSTPSAALPSSLRDAEETASQCNGSLCAGSAAYLAKFNPAGSAASLAVSVDDAPSLTVRNLGAAQATGVSLSSSVGAVLTTCPSILPGGGECQAILPGTGASTLTISASNTGTQQVSVPAAKQPAAASLVFSPRELDFGVVSSVSSPSVRSITVTNLDQNAQTFTSALDASSASRSPFTEVSTDCASSGALTTKVLAAGATCHIQVGLTASANAANNGILSADWLIGNRDVFLTGYSQAGAMVLSAPELDFGTAYVNGSRLPRYLFLTNVSAAPFPHAAATLPAGSPFVITDTCPSTIAAGVVCRIKADYISSGPSQDSATLALDAGASVLLTGQTLPAHTASGSTVNPNLSVTPAAISFSNAVSVTGVSSSTQNVSVTNNGASPFALSLAVSGDFSEVTSCGAMLAARQTCAIAVSFAPSQPGQRSGVLAVTAGAGSSPADVTLTGTGTAILPGSGSYDFGRVIVGQPRVQFYKVAQPFSTLSLSTTGPYTVALVEDIGYGYGHPASSAYAASLTSSCSNCYLAVRFLPAASGAQPGSLTLTSAAGGSAYVVSLTGQGLPGTGLLLTPTTQDFGTVPVNSTSGSVLFTVTNLVGNGNAVTVGSPSLTGDFTEAGTAGASACSGTLAYTASCQIQVSFAPSAAGVRTGTLTVGSTSGSVSASLTGFASADPGISIRPLALTFSNVPGTAETQQAVTLTNTGGAALQVGTPSITTSSFQVMNGCGTLPPGATCTMQVTYTAAAATMTDTLTIPVISLQAGGNAQLTNYTVQLTGAYTSVNAGLEIVPGQAAFGPVPTSTLGGARQFVINNLTRKALNLSVLIPRNFALTGAPCVTLAANGSCSLEVEFTPLTGGDQTGTLFAQGMPTDGTAGVAGLGYLTGYGTAPGQLSVSRLQSGNVLSFGQVNSGQSASQTLTLSNSGPAGSAPVTVRRVTSAPPFLSTSTCGSALSVGQSCTVTVSYGPSNQVATGTVSPASTSDTGLLVIESDAVSSPDLVNLSGQGGPVAVSSPANQTPIALYTLSQSSLSFSMVSVGDASPAQTLTLTNTGTAILHVLSLHASPDFTVSSACGTLLPGANCTASVASTPQTPGTHLSALQIATDSSVSLEFVTLLSESTPASLVVSPAALNFGSVQVGSPATLPVQVTNSGSMPATFTGVSTTGDYRAGGNCPAPGAVLAAGATCTIQIIFTPGAVGSRTGALLIATSATNLSLSVALSGTGIQSRLLVSPANLAFGSIAMGASAGMPLTLTNSGTAPINGLALSVSGDYAVTVPCASNTLAPGASCTVQVTFTPSVTGSRPGSLTISSSDPSSPLTVSLTGTGVQAGSIVLTVNGGSSASAVVKSGSPASFALTVTPLGGFTGNVALTCAPVNAGSYMTCSLQPSSVSLAGAPVFATVTLNTITSAAIQPPLGRTSLAWCLLVPLVFLSRWRRLRLPKAFRAMGPLAVLWIFILLSGCGGSGNVTNDSIHFTPTGTYQYQVTAASTTGLVVSQSVTLNVTVD